MNIKNIKIFDIIFSVINLPIIILGLYFFIDGWMSKSEANRRQFEEASTMSQQSYFQEVQLMNSNLMTIGILILIFSILLIHFYFRFIRK